MVYNHPACIEAEQLLRSCTTTRSRTSGPGGQHRNKVSSAVYILHTPSNVSGEATERRSQHENQKQAIFRLRVNLALAVRMPLDDGYEPSSLLCTRIRKSKLKVNPEHDDFPAILAEVLDVVSDSGYDLKRSSELMGISSTQLVNLLRVENRALAIINGKRAELNLHPLK